jgi:acetyl esterase/lipase
MVDAKSLKTMSNAYLASSPRDHYLEPLYAPQQWWLGLPVSKVLNLGGGDEIFVDDIIQFGKDLMGSHPKVTTIISPQSGHVQPAIDYLIYSGVPGEQALEISRWIACGAGS